jgi:hypothetical protein
VTGSAAVTEISLPDRKFFHWGLHGPIESVYLYRRQKSMGGDEYADVGTGNRVLAIFPHLAVELDGQLISPAGALPRGDTYNMQAHF